MNPVNSGSHCLSGWIKLPLQCGPARAAKGYLKKNEQFSEL